MAWIALGALAVVSMIAAGWFFGSGESGQTDLTDGVVASAQNSENDQTEDDQIGSDQADGDQADGDQAGDDSTESAEPAATTVPAETSTPTTAVTTTTEETTPPSTGPIATKEELDGRYVAILWSQVGDPPASLGGNTEMERQIAAYTSRFGDDVRGVDSDLFGSLRDGTIAVVYDGGFASALEAKQWCRDNNFFGTADCFGVVLSDEHTPDEQGEFIRVYDL